LAVVPHTSSSGLSCNIAEVHLIKRKAPALRFIFLRPM
jgi:hypothetical protein